MGDVTKWDERYARGEHATEQPTRLLMEVAERLAPGRALDLACGAGRHALHLARKGFAVVAVDGSGVAMDRVRTRAAELGLAERLTTFVADLETTPPGYVPDPESFDLVCVFYYLNRALMPILRAAVRPGGHFIAAIHTVDTHEAGDAYDNPDLPAKLLRPGELRAGFAGWQFIHDREIGADDDPGDRHHHGTAELVARRSDGR